jgi:hypothetical protein
VHWTDAGPTNLANAVLLCHRHHTLVHEAGWRIVATDEGRWLAVPPPTRFEPWLSTFETVELRAAGPLRL